MVHKIKFFLIIFLCFFLTEGFAITYYVSQDGNDAKDGKSPANAWKTINKVNNVRFGRGDVILFRRGDTFRGTIILDNPLARSMYNLTFGAYGTGNLPIISGSTHVTNWRLFRDNIYVADNVNSKVSKVFINKQEMTLARFPNHDTFLYMDEGSNSNSFIDLDADLMQFPASVIIGSNCRSRTVDWSIETRQVGAFNNGTFTLASPFHYNNKKGNGYFLDNKIEYLDTEGEWFYDEVAKKLYVIAPNNIDPNQLLVEASILEHGFHNPSANAFLHNFIFENLRFEEQSTDGLLISRATNLIIRNVEFHGQGFDGIEVNASGGLIENCKFTHIHGKGIRISGSNNRIIKNIFKKIGMRPEYTIRAIANSAISTHISSSSQILIQSNIIDSVGYIGIDAAGSNHIVEKNIVSNACMSIDDGGGIYVFGATSVGTIIRNNIVKNLLGNRNGSPNAHTLAIGIYVDNYCSNITVENNTIINAKGEGIRLNSLASNCKVINNTVYDAKDADLRIRTAAGEASGSMGHTVSGNVLYGLDKDDLPMMVNGYVGSDFPGVFDRNYYVNPYNSLIIRKDELNMGSVRHSLAGWQARHRQDMNGKTSFYKLNTWIVTDTLSKNFIPNGNFSSGVAGWSRWPNDNNTITWDRTTFPQGGMNISVNSVTRVDYAYIFTRDVFSFKQGSYYQLSFDVGAIRNGTIIVSSRTNGGSTIINLNQSVAVSSNIEKVNIVFQAASTTMADFAFNVPISTGTIWVDNVVLQEIKVSPDDPKQRNPIFVNETNQTQTFSLGSLIHYDLDNNEVVNTITVPAYSSRILVRTDKPVPPPQKITAFSLLDSANRVIKAGLTNNDTIDFNKIRANNLFIRATTNPPVVGSIRFSANANTVNDNQAPYLFPFSNKQYKGNTNLTVTPHTLADGLGRVGEIANLNLIFVNRNVIPVANAGLDQNITLPTNSITINGAGTDADGSITRFLWTKVSGGNATLSNINFPNLIVSGLSVGTYVFRLTVTDNDAVTNSDDVQVTVHPALTNITRFEVFNVKTKRSSNFTNNSTINFSTLGTDSVYIRAIPSTLVNNIIFNFNNANSTVTESPYQILLINRQLTGNQTLTAVPTDAQNRQGNTATLNFSIQNRQNINPVANAGSDKSITLPINTISLQGTGIDTDGRITKFEWTKVSGGNATLVNANTANLTVNDLTVGTYVFRLTVTDNENATHSDEVQVTVNSALASITQFSIINPRNNQSIGTISSNSVIDFAQLGIDSVFVRAIPSTPVNSVAFNFNNATISRNTAPYQILLINRQLTGNQTLTAVPTDTQNRQGNTATLNFSIQNRQNINPVANAGNDRSITLPTNTIALQGSGIDADGRITKFEWTKVSGGNATLANANTATLNASNLAVGIYVFRLTVTDNDNATHSDEVQVTVNNALASISRFELFNPRTNQIIGFNNNSIIDFAQLGVDSVFVRAIPSTALNSVAFNFNNATISRNTAPYQILLRNRQLTGNQTLTAVPTDTQNRQGNTATLNFSIQNRQNTNPVANAGNDRSITLPTNTITLQGIGTDTDGSIASFVWTQVSGNSATLANANTVNLTVNNLTVGTYVFRLTVTDNENATHSDEVQVTVNNALASISRFELFNPRTNQIISFNNNSIIDFAQLGVDSVFVRAIPSTAVNSVVFSFNNTTISRNTAPYQILLINRQLTGNQTLTAIPTDTQNRQGNTATLNFSIQNRQNINPVANAGNDRSITLPTNTIALQGSGIDADGRITKFEWTKVSGGNATLVNANTATLNASNLAVGIYVFRLTVTDNDNATHSDEVQVTVNNALASISRFELFNPRTNQIISFNNNSIIDFAQLGVDSVFVRAIPSTAVNSVAFNFNNTTISRNTAPYQILLRNRQLTGNQTLTAVPTDTQNRQGNTATLNFSIQNRQNTNPVANAGNDRSITIPTNTIILQGIGTDTDGSVASFAWTQVSGNPVTLANANTANLTVNNLLEGTYLFRLTVTDNENATHSDEVQVTVSRPTLRVTSLNIINANTNAQIAALREGGVIDFNTLGTDRIFIRANVLSPVGSLVFDLNGQKTMENFAPYEIIINNRQINGAQTLTVTPFSERNGLGLSGNAFVVNFSVINRLNLVPIVNAGADQTITLPTSSINLIGQVSDADGTIANHVWTKISGGAATLTNPNFNTLTVSGLQQGSYVFRLTATDNEGGIGSDEVSINVIMPSLTVSAVNLVNNQNQTIRTLSNNATIDFNTLAGDVVYLRASVQPANLIGSVVFTINGQTIVKDGAPFEIALRNGDFQGNTTITITPYSQTGGKGTAGSPTNLQFQVINRNLLPIVSAGSNQTITQPTSNATLSGRATDSDGQIVRTVWRQISGNKAIIADSTKLSTSINQLSVGEYTFRLLATDNRGGIGSADVQITVRPEPMSIIQIVLINPINNTQVGILTNNSVIDFGALKLQKVQLRAVIQPANVGSVIFNHNRVNKIQNFAPYDISIDNGGTVINHTLTVTPYRNTNGQGEAGQGLSFNFSVRNRVNQAPTIQVANIHSITLPVNNIIINATANDTDGSISSYVWSQINGASNAILLNTNTANLTANNLVQGTYLFRLTVTDNERATANADVTVTVLPPASIQRPETLEPNPIVTLVVRGDVLCNGGKARLVAKGAPSNASYAWFAQPQGGNPIARQADSVWTTSFISTTTDYYVAAMINDKELTQSRVKVTATINAAPIAQIQQGSTIEFCESGELSAVSVSNSTVEWYFNKAVVSKSEKFVVTQSGVYTLKVRRNGCEATSTPINVTIQKSFEAIIAQGESVSFLANGQISANPVPSASYEWFNAENQLIGNTLTLRVDKSGAYRVRITKGKCVVTSKAINVNIIEAQKPIIMPALSIVATRNVCEGGKLSLSANDIKDAVYQWTGPNGFQQNGNHIEVAYSNKLITGYYKLKVSLLGKEANDSIFVNVSKGFNINVITEQPICYGDNGGSVKLNALSKQEFTFVLGNQQIKGTEAQFSALKAGDYQIKAIDIVGCEKVFNISIKNPAPINLQVSKDQVITLNNYAQLQASGADAYRWEPSEGLDNPMSPNPIAKPSQTTTYKVTGTTNNGCSVTKEVTVYVSSEEVVFAKVLSPNNDGVNDMWTIKNLEKYPNNYLAVYDVYGGIVYESTNYQNNWDGTNSRGFLPDGAYFFTLKINDLAGGEGKIFSGTINLHR